MRKMLLKGLFVLFILLATVVADGFFGFTDQEFKEMKQLCCLESQFSMVNGLVYTYSCSAFFYKCMDNKPFAKCKYSWLNSLNTKGDVK